MAERLNSALPQYLGPLSIERRMKTLGHVLFYNHAAAQKKNPTHLMRWRFPCHTVCRGVLHIAKMVYVFFFFAKVLFRRRFCPSITQQLDRCNPKLYLFDNPVAKCMCNNSRRGWLSSASVSALRRGRWPLPTGFGLVPNHRHVNTTLTGGIYRMVQPNSSTRWAFEYHLL